MVDIKYIFALKMRKCGLCLSLLLGGENVYEGCFCCISMLVIKLLLVVSFVFCIFVL